MTGDGASVMIAFGDSSPFEYLICLNHSIHLAVIETIFTATIDAEGDVSYLDNEDENFDSSDANDAQTFQGLEGLYKDTVDKMRAIVKFFKISPVRNSILQEKLKENGRKQLQLMLDSKTRWNSLVLAAKRFIDLLPDILESLNSLGSTLSWDEDDSRRLQVGKYLIFFNDLIFYCFLQILIDVLEPALTATEALSKGDITFIEGELIIKTLVSEVEKIPWNLAHQFHTNLKNKLENRRNSAFASLAMYLSRPTFLSKAETESYPLHLAPKKSVQKLGSEMLKRLFQDETEELNESNNVEQITDTVEMSFRSILNQAIESYWEKNTEDQRNNENGIQRDFKLYELHKKKESSTRKTLFYDL